MNTEQNIKRRLAMFRCAVEPGWVFIPFAKALAQDYHVFLFIADGHDELGTTFVSIEKYVDDAASYLKENGICRLIALKDWVMVMLGTKSYFFMKMAAPPERWTPKGEDPEEYYRKIFAFKKNHYSSKTIYNVFWSAYNYYLPDPVPTVKTKIEYWYGEEEKRAGKNNLAYTTKVFPQTAAKEFKGLAHAELVLVFPERFRKEVIQFLEADGPDSVYMTDRISLTKKER